MASGPNKTTTKKTEQNLEGLLSYEGTIAIVNNKSTLESLTPVGQEPSKKSKVKNQGGKKVKVQTIDPGWTLVKQWLEPKSDKARYAIGISELGIYSNTHAPSFSLTSKPWRSPRPIRSISIDSDVEIPNTYPTDKTWVEFYVSVDNGDTWLPISTLSSAGAAIGRNAAPKRIIVNSSLTEEERVLTHGYVDTQDPVHEIRVRILAFRPEDQPLTTPKVHRYKVKMTV